MICPRCKKVDGIVFEDDLEIDGKCKFCCHEITLISNKIEHDIKEIKNVLVILTTKLENLEKKLDKEVKLVA